MINTVLTEKDAVTEQLRQMILSAPVGVLETSRAEASLSARRCAVSGFRERI